ncbi:MAG: MFS transporter, partial [Chloroflexota bacterium]
YIPIVLLEDGLSVRYAGWVTGIYLFGGMLGNYSGGWLADQTQNGRLVIFLAMVGTILPLWFGVPAVGVLQMVLFFIAGFGSSMPHSVLVLLIQSFFPRGRGFASGLALGGMFFTGSVVSFIVGSLADVWGLTLTLQLIAILPVIAAASAFFIPKPEQ